MPFTLAHPAAVLPLLKRRQLSVAGLIAGSMAPDVPFFTGALVPWSYAAGEFSHHWAGVATLDVVLAAGLLVLWRFVRMPLLGLLPQPAAGKLAALTGPVPAERWPHPVRFALSAAIGAATHVLWDDFTHPDRLGSLLLPVLGKPLLGVRIAWWLQYGTSALALLGMAWLLRRAYAAAVPLPVVPLERTQRTVARALLLVSALAGLGAGWHRYRTVGGVGGTPLDPVSVLCFYTGAALVCWAVGFAGVTRAAALHWAADSQARMPHRDREPASQRDRPAA